MADFQNTYPLIPHRLDADTVAKVRACTSDACGQSRRKCPTPQACVLPERSVRGRGLVLYLLTTLAALAGAVIHFWPQIVAAFEEIL